MTFAAPLFGYLAIMAVPVVLLYLLRQRQRRRVASTLLFWNALPEQIQQRPWWKKLRRWLSLLLQLAFLALLVSLVARPLAKWQTGAPRSQVLVLDPTPSMTATDVKPSRFDEAVTQMRRLIRQKRSSDAFALLQATEPPRILSGWSQSTADLETRLAAAKPVVTDASPEPALELARQLAASREGATIHLFTDLVLPKPPADADATCVVHRIPEASATPMNDGITLFAARRSLVDAEEFAIEIQVASTQAERHTAHLELYRGNSLLDAAEFTVSSTQPWSRTWHYHDTSAAEVTAKLIPAKPDVLALDDTAVAHVPALEGVKVAFAGKPNAFLQTAFLSMSGVEVTPLDGKPSLVVANGDLPTPLPASAAVIFIAPTSSGAWGVKGEAITQPLVSDWKKDHPLLRHSRFDQVRLDKATAFKPAPDLDVFAESFGQALLFGRWDEDRKFIVIPFAFDESDLVLRTAFPILLANAVNTLRHASGNGTSPTAAGISETSLKVLTWPSPKAGAASAPDSLVMQIPWWAEHPLWMWFVSLGLLWVFAEWWMYHRRITE